MIESIFEELKGIGAVNSGTDFSQEWLGMEGSYFRGLRAKQRGPSAKALATCAVRLKSRARLLSASTMPQVRIVASKYDEIAESCVEALLTACEGQQC